MIQENNISEKCLRGQCIRKSLVYFLETQCIKCNFMMSATERCGDGSVKEAELLYVIECVCY